MSDEKPNEVKMSEWCSILVSNEKPSPLMTISERVVETLRADNRAMLELLRELERIGDCPFCRATRGEGFHYHDFRSYSTPCPLGALLDKHGRG